MRSIILSNDDSFASASRIGLPSKRESSSNAFRSVGSAMQTAYPRWSSFSTSARWRRAWLSGSFVTTFRSRFMCARSTNGMFRYCARQLFRSASDTAPTSMSTRPSLRPLTRCSASASLSCCSEISFFSSSSSPSRTRFFCSATVTSLGRGAGRLGRLFRLVLRADAGRAERAHAVGRGLDDPRPVVVAVDDDGSQQDHELRLDLDLARAAEQLLEPRYAAEHGCREVALRRGVAHETPDRDDLAAARLHDAVRFPDLAERERQLVGLAGDGDLLLLIGHVAHGRVDVQDHLARRADLRRQVERDAREKRRKRHVP